MKKTRHTDEQIAYHNDLRLRLNRLVPVADNGFGGTIDRVEQTFFNPDTAFREAQQVDLPAVFAQVAGKAARAR